MTKVTKKEFIQALKDSRGYFLASVTNKTVKEVIEMLDKFNKDNIKNQAIYKIKSIEEKSNSIAFSTNRDNEKSYRYFNGHNEYFTHNGYILHKSSNGEENANFIMINA